MIEKNQNNMGLHFELTCNQFKTLFNIVTQWISKQKRS